MDFGRSPRARGFGNEGVFVGFKNVLCSDGERRTALGTDYDVEIWGGYSRVFKVRVWDYNRNERVEIQGVLRATDQDDRVFCHIPDESWQLPDWTSEVLAEAHGIVMNRYGMKAHDFLFTWSAG